MLERVDYTRFGIAATRNERGELTLTAHGRTLGPEAAADFAAWLVEHIEPSAVSYPIVDEPETEHINTSTGPVEVAKRRPGRPRKVGN